MYIHDIHNVCGKPSIELTQKMLITTTSPDTTLLYDKSRLLVLLDIHDASDIRHMWLAVQFGSATFGCAWPRLPPGIEARVYVQGSTQYISLGLSTAPSSGRVRISAIASVQLAVEVC